MDKFPESERERAYRALKGEEAVIDSVKTSSGVSDALEVATVEEDKAAGADEDDGEDLYFDKPAGAAKKN